MLARGPVAEHQRAIVTAMPDLCARESLDFLGVIRCMDNVGGVLAAALMMGVTAVVVGVLRF